MGQNNVVDCLDYKVLQAIIYAPDSVSKLYQGNFDEYIFTPSFLRCLELYTNSHSVQVGQYLSETDKQTIHTLVSYIRECAEFDTLEEKKGYYDQFNRIICQVNMLGKGTADGWLCNQAINRYGILNSLRIIRSGIYAMETEIRSSVGYDYQVLLAHFLKEVDTPSFQEKFRNNKYYFMCINALLQEGVGSLLQKEDIQKMVHYCFQNLSNLSKEDKVFVLKQSRKYVSRKMLEK